MPCWLQATASSAVNTAWPQAAPGDAGVLLSGFVTGDDRALTAARRDAFLRTSTVHLTAVSGANLALLVAVIAGTGSAFGVGKRFDALWLAPRPGTPLDVALRHATGPEDALARAFALGSPADVAGVWVDGQPLQPLRPGDGHDGAPVPAGAVGSWAAH